MGSKSNPKNLKRKRQMIRTSLAKMKWHQKMKLRSKVTSINTRIKKSQKIIVQAIISAKGEATYVGSSSLDSVVTSTSSPLILLR